MNVFVVLHMQLITSLSLVNINKLDYILILAFFSTIHLYCTLFKIKCNRVMGACTIFCMTAHVKLAA